MAFSQVQCLDDSHVNWRSSESKPEFFYSEEQRLALEALVARGREAFYEVLKRENIRDFLSELELKRILETIEVYDPGSQDLRGDVRSRGPEDDGVGDSEEASRAGGDATQAEPPPSLEYWPQKSDRSIPQLDLGWPDTIAYRGVTRASVYMQPPIDGQAHIKEVVRKMISQAQKVSQLLGGGPRTESWPSGPERAPSISATAVSAHSQHRFRNPNTVLCGSLGCLPGCLPSLLSWGPQFLCMGLGCPGLLAGDGGLPHLKGPLYIIGGGGCSSSDFPRPGKQVPQKKVL